MAPPAIGNGVKHRRTSFVLVAGGSVFTTFTNFVSLSLPKVVDDEEDFVALDPQSQIIFLNNMRSSLVGFMTGPGTTPGHAEVTLWTKGAGQLRAPSAGFMHYYQWVRQK